MDIRALFAPLESCEVQPKKKWRFANLPIPNIPDATKAKGKAVTNNSNEQVMSIKTVAE
jgi:hypothetical protein